MFCALGALAQFWIGRRIRAPRIPNALVAFLFFFIYMCDEENLIPPVRRMLPASIRADILPAAMVVWSLGLVLAAICIFLRDRIPPFRDDRRQLLRASSAVACAAIPAAVFGFAVLNRKDFHINELDIQVPNLARDLQGVRILQISDIHAGPFFTIQDVARVVDACNGLPHDIATITGDLITERYDPLERCIRELGRLRATHGVWGCLGNHEMYAKLEDHTEFLAREAGIRILRKQNVALPFGQARMNLVGVDYQRGGTRYLMNIDDLISPDSLNVLLSHNPDVFPVAAAKGFDLTLAGHTHGGQINLEIVGKNLNVADFATPFTRGFYGIGFSSLYVNSGLGTIGLPIRLGAPPEISVIRLCSA